MGECVLYLNHSLACGCYSADRQVGECVLYLNHSLACGCYSADRQVGECVLYLNHSLACGCYSADRQVGECVLYLMQLAQYKKLMFNERYMCMALVFNQLQASSGIYVIHHSLKDNLE